MTKSATKTSILVFSSRGGGGHVAASEALFEALGCDYELEVANALTDVFQGIDLFSRFSGKKLCGEDVYNFMLKKRFFRLTNLYGQMGKLYMVVNKPYLVKAAKEFILKKKPEMIVSVIPFFNGAFLEAAHELNIPFWLIPTDVELSTFLTGMNRDLCKTSNFKLGLAYDAQIEQALNKGICAEQIFRIGFPVKKACVEQYSEMGLAEIRRSLHIQEKARVITLTLGASGTSLFYRFTKALAEVGSTGLELNCCAGKDLRSFYRVQKWLDQVAVCETKEANQSIYRLSSGNRLHLWKFTKQLPQLMAVSDLIISKTGSLSVSEALHLNKYLLLDHTLNSSSRWLKWERANLPFVRSLAQGDGFKSARDLQIKVEEFLNLPMDSFEKGCFLNIHEQLPQILKGEEL